MKYKQPFKFIPCIIEFYLFKNEEEDNKVHITPDSIMNLSFLGISWELCEKYSQVHLFNFL